jgi:hypothetical protein
MTYKRKNKDNYAKRELKELPFILAHLEKRLYECIKLGEKGNKLKHLRYKRNLCRVVLMEKLQKWDADGRKEDYSFSKVIEKSDNLSDREI